MPRATSLQEIERYLESDYFLLSIKDMSSDDVVYVQDALCPEDAIPYIYAISRNGKTSLGRYISDRKNKDGIHRFGIPNDEQIPLELVSMNEEFYVFREYENGTEHLARRKPPFPTPIPIQKNATLASSQSQATSNQSRPNIGNSRYKCCAIGNAQNYFIRNLLSNIGQDSFSESKWIEVKSWFGNRCAYCGGEESLVMDHAVPINRTDMGEHKIGNLVPSCKDCNSKKAGKLYTDFISRDTDVIERIREHMRTHNYTPISETDKATLVSEVLDMAHSEVKLLADRYTKLINFILM